MSGDDLLPILGIGHPTLRRQAAPLDPSDLRTAEVQRLIARMRATMEAAPGVGLAAPQVGEPIQLAVLQDGPARWTGLSAEQRRDRDRRSVPFTVLANPVVTSSGNATATFYEGCLSVPALTGAVGRHADVHVTALDEHGEPCALTYSGWPARIVQHEVDHLNGVLYLDRADTRSLSTLDVYGERWAQQPVPDIAAALGFST